MVPEGLDTSEDEFFFKVAGVGEIPSGAESVGVLLGTVAVACPKLWVSCSQRTCVAGP